MNSKIIIEKLKNHSFVLWVLLIVALVTGVSSFFTSIDSLVNLANKYLKTEAVVEIVSAKNPLTNAAAKEKGFEISHGSEDHSEYAILLHINAKYKNHKYNRQPYLKSISELVVNNTPEGKVKISASRIHLDTLENSKGLDGYAFLVFQSKPTPTEKIRIMLGPNTWTLPIGYHEWQRLKYEYGAKNNNWYRAQASLDLPIGNPSWPLIHVARLLKSTDQNISLIEIVVENCSKEPLPLENLILHASHPRNPNVSCAMPDQKQTLNLDWSMITAESSNGGAWTNLSDTKVKVPVKYNGRGRCSGYSFFAVVPIQYNIDPGNIGRIIVKLNELPKQGKNTKRVRLFGSSFKFRVPNLRDIGPGPVVNWSMFRVALNSSKDSKQIYPSKLNVSRKNESDILLEQLKRFGLN